MRYQDFYKLALAFSMHSSTLGSISSTWIFARCFLLVENWIWLALFAEAILIEDANTESFATF